MQNRTARKPHESTLVSPGITPSTRQTPAMKDSKMCDMRHHPLFQKSNLNSRRRCYRWTTLRGRESEGTIFLLRAYCALQQRSVDVCGAYAGACFLHVCSLPLCSVYTKAIYSVVPVS
uniref:Uncharacterized protein n=1 Tax=Onchocerca volvulus TaxID=6282 RepID=A0A8R1XRA4_ONCVO